MPAAKPAPSRRDAARQAVRRQIMDAARQLFVAKGYEAATLRDLAKAIDYTPSALYYHFKDKAELMQAICEEDFQALGGHFQEALAGPDPLRNILAMGRAYARFAQEYPNHYRLMFMTSHPATLAPEAEQRKGDPEQDAYAALLHMVTLAMERGMLRPELRDPHLVAQTFWAGIHGVVTLELDKGCEDWVPWAGLEARVELLGEAMVRGLAR
jgi:AcrR family transcriptional regulator